MRNEEIKKLADYSNQIHKFALSMEDEMKTAGNFMWEKFSKELLHMWVGMNEDLVQRTQGRE